jgi:hypothetical protein
LSPDFRSCQSTCPTSSLGKDWCRRSVSAIRQKKVQSTSRSRRRGSSHPAIATSRRSASASGLMPLAGDHPMCLKDCPILVNPLGSAFVVDLALAIAGGAPGMRTGSRCTDRHCSRQPRQQTSTGESAGYQNLQRLRAEKLNPDFVAFEEDLRAPSRRAGQAPGRLTPEFPPLTFWTASGRARQVFRHRTCSLGVMRAPPRPPGKAWYLIGQGLVTNAATHVRGGRRGRR